MDLMNKIGSFNGLLKEFRQASRSSKKVDEDRAKAFSTMLVDYEFAMQYWQKSQETKADHFNLLEVVDLTFDEVRHSMILAWLLDARTQNFGTHAQGTLGFSLFLSEFRLPQEYAACKYSVRREVSEDESRVDVRIESAGRFIIDIENKILSAEGIDQTNREWRDLKLRAKVLGVPESAIHAFFLSPDRREPINENFLAISYDQLMKVFESFSEDARAMDVRLFAAHYAKVLRKFICCRPFQPLEEII